MGRVGSGRWERAAKACRSSTRGASGGADRRPFSPRPASTVAAGVTAAVTLIRTAATAWPRSRSRSSRRGTSWRSLAATAALAPSSDQPVSSSGPGAHARGQRRRQERQDGGEHGVRLAQPVDQPGERLARAHRFGHRAGRRRARGRVGESPEKSSARGRMLKFAFLRAQPRPATPLHSRPPAAVPASPCPSRHGPPGLLRDRARPSSRTRTRMLPKLLTSIFGSRNDRLLKQYRQVVQKINALESGFSALSDEALRNKTFEFRQRVAGGETLAAHPARGLRRGARGQQAHAEDAPLRRPADRRHGAQRRQDRRDAHRRGQDADGDPAGLPQLAHRQGRAPGHGQRLPGPARCRVDGAALQLHGPHGRRQHAADVARGQAGGLRRRRDLRHEQRVRLRLPARQHGPGRRRPGRARPVLRDRRRGRLDPDRRGAHAADHQRPGRGPHRAVRPHQRGRAEPQEADRRARPAHRRRRDRARRLHRRREDAPGLPHRGRPRERRAAAARGAASWSRARACTTRPTSR